MAISADMIPSIKDQEATAVRMGSPRQVLSFGSNCFWPGHTWNPICHLNCTQLDEDYSKSLVPFTPKLYENSDIEVIPFTVNPFNDLSDRVPKALENLQVNSSLCREGAYKINNAQVLFHAAYPIYWPVYVVEFIESRKRAGDLPTTIVLRADSAGLLPVYEWCPKWGGVDQWNYNNAWIRFDVTVPEWYNGFWKRDIPLEQLRQRYYRQVVGKFQTRPINWEDNRILSYTDHQKQNNVYLDQLYKIWAKRSLLSRMETVSDNERILVPGEAINNPGGKRLMRVDELRKEIISEVGNDLKELKQSEPVWYKKYKNKFPSYKFPSNE